MTRLQIQIVQDSLKCIQSRREISTIFHNFLFTLDPALRPLFTEDLRARENNFLMMLKFIVETSERIYIFTPSLEAYGRKVRRYGLSNRQYQMIGAAFILALRQTFGAEISPEIENAWLKAYALVADAMKSSPVRQKTAL